MSYLSSSHPRRLPLSLLPETICRFINPLSFFRLTPFTPLMAERPTSMLAVIAFVTGTRRCLSRMTTACSRSSTRRGRTPRDSRVAQSPTPHDAQCRERTSGHTLWEVFDARLDATPLPALRSPARLLLLARASPPYTEGGWRVAGVEEEDGHAENAGGRGEDAEYEEQVRLSQSV
ncbi:hypothetical protein FB451DRAFT_1556699 [Mycena latifolia]|nr:hypothetical protein FB451DRAFT_1556699 [Mycena latifolia]